MARKYDSIDLFKLYSKGSHVGWNNILDKCYAENDINQLAKIRYQIQSGMDDLVKLKMNDEKMILFFIRLNRSLELTAKKIIRKMYPLPNDVIIKDKKNPGVVAKDAMTQKRLRDKTLEKFFRDSAF